MLPQLLAAHVYAQGRLQLEHTEDTREHKAWINRNFAQFKVLGQKTRYGQIMWLDALLTVYHKCVLNASFLTM